MKPNILIPVSITIGWIIGILVAAALEWRRTGSLPRRMTMELFPFPVIAVWAIYLMT